LAGTSGCGTYLCSITAVAAGQHFNLFLKSDGTVYSCGYNGYGELGNNTTTDQSIPVQVLTGTSGCGTYLCNITAISAGQNHSLFLKNDGTVWACGANSSGQLGDGTTTQRNTPVQVNGLTGIIAVSAGWNHSLFLKNDGTVWACGDNANGQLGDNTTVMRTAPVQVLAGASGCSTYLCGISAVAGGKDHSLFLMNDGTAWACGDNALGQLGDNTTADASTPVQVLAGTSGCSANLCGIISIAAGQSHSLFLKSGNTVWACGLNSNGQLGDGTTTQHNTVVQMNTCTVSILPVELLSFTADCDNQNVKLNWTTASETNNTFFTIEKSWDGKNFEPIGTVAGAGNSSAQKSYEFTDPEPATGSAGSAFFYRLKQTDFNGSYTYFGPITSSCEPDSKWDVTLQNFISGNILEGILKADENTNAIFIITDMQGRKIFSSEITVKKGSSFFQFDLPDLSNGIYLAQVCCEKNWISKKIVRGNL
jgi:alpha-tubulin suppressor-like RCC1 family protein